MFIDHFIRADTEADLKAALPFAVRASALVEPVSGETISPAGGWITSSPGLFELDLIGPLMVEDGVYGEPDPETGEREEITPPVIDEGFHANLRLVGAYAPDIPTEVITTPSNPRRVFA